MLGGHSSGCLLKHAQVQRLSKQWHGIPVWLKLAGVWKRQYFDSTPQRSHPPENEWHVPSMITPKNCKDSELDIGSFPCFCRSFEVKLTKWKMAATGIINRKQSNQEWTPVGSQPGPHRLPNMSPTDHVLSGIGPLQSMRVESRSSFHLTPWHSMGIGTETAGSKTPMGATPVTKSAAPGAAYCVSNPLVVECGVSLGREADSSKIALVEESDTSLAFVSSPPKCHLHSKHCISCPVGRWAL